MRIRMCQWVHMALLALCIAIPTQSWALGLGELEVESALNERFAGSIELLDAQGFQASEVFVSMASSEDFERVGVERFFYLTNIRFEVEFAANGSADVKVSSTQPVSEPYLNFIVEVLWPNGRLLKEFTVLLDPPTFSEATAPAVTAPRESVTQSRRQPTARQTQSRTGTQVELQPSASTPRQPPADGLMTSRQDTLWKIALASLPSNSVSVHQQMLAIQRKNPEAFINENINLLKAGYVLDMPTESEALSVGQANAVADVATQAEDWRSGATADRLADRASGADSGESPDLRSQVDASSTQNAQTSTGTQTQGDVRIVANTGELASGTASGETPNVNQLIEEKETLARQVDELTYQLDREKDIAVNQVTVKDRQLDVKDQELAQAQQSMKELREQLAAASQNQNQNQSPQPVAEEAPWWMSPMVLFGVIGALILILATALVSLRKSKAERDALYEFDQAELDDQPADEQFEEVASGFNEEDVNEENEALAEDSVEGTEAPGNQEPFIGELDDDEASQEIVADNQEEVLELSDEENSEEIASSDDADSETTSAANQTGDVIGEAEIYIAYGRYSQAASLLSGVLDQEADRWDIRLKLLEVYVESHDEENFGVHAQYIVDHCEDEDVLLACRELESQLGSIKLDDVDTAVDADATAGEQTAADDDGFALELEDLEPAAAEDEANAEKEVDLDDLPLLEDAPMEDAVSELDGDETTIELAGDPAGLEPEAGQESAEKDLDFELEFDGELETLDDAVEENGGTETTAVDEAHETHEALEAEGGVESADAGADLGGDLGLDFDPDDTSTEPVETVEQEEAIAEEQADSDDFEFDADGESDINATKLDLAEAYVDMGDADGAQDILNEVLEEGTSEQKEKAQEMLNSLAG